MSGASTSIFPFNLVTKNLSVTILLDLWFLFFEACSILVGTEVEVLSVVPELLSLHLFLHYFYFDSPFGPRDKMIKNV